MKIFEDHDDYEYQKTQWVESKSDSFFKSISSVLKDDEFRDEIAESIAWSHYNDENCNKLFSAHSLDWKNALCYLSLCTGSRKYEDEINEAFQEYLSDIE